MSAIDPFLLARLLLGLTFTASGLIHLADRRTLLLKVLEYQVLPLRLARLYAHWMPWVESIAGLAVLFGVLSGPSALVLLALLASFAVAVAANLVRGRRFECGCFGELMGGRIGAWTLIRIGVLITLALLLILRSPALAGLMAGPSGQRDTLATILVGVFVLLAVYIAENVPLLRTVLFKSGSATRERVR